MEFKIMGKNPGSFRNSGAYTSPGTPEYGDNFGEFPKGWSSERVPMAASRRDISAAALIPFNSGRALPSKWDDAERWITSPVSGQAASATQPQRQPKSKSGPLGSPGHVYLSNYSPTMDGATMKNFMGYSSLMTGVLLPDEVPAQYEAEMAVKSFSFSGNNISRSTSVPGLSNYVGETSVPSSQDCFIEEEEGIGSPEVLHRDMATQMSPKGSIHSSSRGTVSLSILSSSSLGPNVNPYAKDDIRDVQVDKGTSTGRQVKKQRVRKSTGPRNVEDLPSTWSPAQASQNIKFQREEAKITAWENLQKAKANAAIQKLEMRLENKRTTSMDKISNKLRVAQAKAQAMRNDLSENRVHQTRIGGNSFGLSAKIRTIAQHFLCHRN